MDDFDDGKDDDDAFWDTPEEVIHELPYENVDASDEDSGDDTASSATYPNGKNSNSGHSSQEREFERPIHDPPVVHRPAILLDNGDSATSSRSQKIILTPAQLSEIQDQNERRSARFVKRKKFADEIVEASLRPAYYRNRSATEPKSVPAKGSSHESLSPRTATGPSTLHERPVRKKSQSSPRVPETVTKPKSTKKNWTGGATMSSNQNFGYGGSFEPFDNELDNGFAQFEHEPEDLSGITRAPADQKKLKISKKKPVITDESASRKAWAAMDDLKLISALPQLFDFALVAKYVSFSTKVEADFLEQRWTELLNDPEACRETVEGLDRIPLDTIQRIRKMKFFTEGEEEMVKTVLAGNATVENFERILSDFSYLFLPGRLPEDLLSCWKYVSQRVKTELGKEPPDTNPEIPADLAVLRSGNRIDDIQTRASCFGQALISYTGHLNYRSKHVGCEVAYLKALSERVATGSLPDQQRPKFHRDHKSTLAFLSGVCVDYAIINEEATFGYSDENTTVDIDLSLEGNIVNLVPLQGVIYLDVNGMFHIENFGFSTISVNGFLLERGNDFDLPDTSAVDIGTLTFQFYRNASAVTKHIDRAKTDFVNRARTEKARKEENDLSDRSTKADAVETEFGNGDLSDSGDNSDSSDSAVNGGQLYMDVEERQLNGGFSPDDLEHDQTNEFT